MSVRLEVTLSVVSHGQGGLVQALLVDLMAETDASFEVVLTLNLPEDESFIPVATPYPLRVLRNTAPRGFGANHNAAFRVSRGQAFAVVNPDIRAQPLRLAPLLRLLSPPLGVCGPAVYDVSGRLQDSARRFPTVWRLLQRVVLRRHRQDYALGAEPVTVDWIAGMFMVFDSTAFESVGGFDERYHMYFEDADICRRLRRAGWQVALVPSSIVVHEARRASRRNLQHMRWHLASAARFLFGSIRSDRRP